MRTGNPTRVLPAVLAGAAALALSGCVLTDVPPADPPEPQPPELGLNVAPTYCYGLWHMPNSNFAGSLSWALYATLVETDDDSDLPDLTDASIMVDGLPDAQATVDGDGVVVGVLPLTSFGSYPITGLGVTTADGEKFSLSADYEFVVAADEYDVTCEGDSAQAETIRQSILVSPIVDF